MGAQTLKTGGYDNVFDSRVIIKETIIL